ncbi:MAG: cell division protein FtsH, partial [Pedococcus sp.]
AHDEAWHVINDNRDILDSLVLDLLEHETLNAKELATIFEPIRKRPIRPTWLSSETRFLSDQPPVLTPAEKAAQNGSSPALEAAGTNRQTAEAIDKAAEAGAVKAPEEHPPTQVIEIPEGGQVDPNGH